MSLTPPSLSPDRLTPIPLPPKGRYKPAYTVPGLKAFTAEALSHHQKDIFLESPLRYAGFTNEVTMAIRSVPLVVRRLPFLNPLGWAVAFAYGLGHAYYRALNKQSANLENHRSPGEARKKSHIAALKAIGFHSLATWFGPSLIIEAEKKVTEGVFHKLGKPARNWPAAIGIASIPLITKVMDPLIEKPVDRVARDFYIKAEQQYS